MSDLVGNPTDRFSPVVAHMMHVVLRAETVSLQSNHQKTGEPLDGVSASCVLTCTPESLKCLAQGHFVVDSVINPGSLTMESCILPLNHYTVFEFMAASNYM